MTRIYGLCRFTFGSRLVTTHIYPTFGTGTFTLPVTPPFVVYLPYPRLHYDVRLLWTVPDFGYIPVGSLICVYICLFLRGPGWLLAFGLPVYRQFFVTFCYGGCDGCYLPIYPHICCCLDSLVVVFQLDLHFTHPAPHRLRSPHPPFDVDYSCGLPTRYTCLTPRCIQPTCLRRCRHCRTVVILFLTLGFVSGLRLGWLGWLPL